MAELSILEGLNQNYFSPFLIFIKGTTKLADSELLNVLNLNDYNKVDNNSKNQSYKDATGYLFIAGSDEWTCIMDDWSYTLWHNNKIRSRLLSMSKDFDVFYCSVGDIDDAFDFAYFQNGQIVREYIVEDNSFTGGVVVKDSGIPFPVENEAFKHKEIYEKVITVAKSLGIKFLFDKEDVRIYYKNNSSIEYLDPL